MKIRYTIFIGLFLILLLTSILISTFLLSQGECSSGMFMCSQGGKCVPQRSICDGFRDCPDGEDDSGTMCGNFHGSNFIYNLMLNKTFNVTYENCELKGVDEGCYCWKKDRVYCKSLNLTTPPTQIQGNISRLILANNSIAVLPENAFKNYQLTVIHLQGNGIKNLPTAIFKGQTKLSKILLMDNLLTEIDDYLFRNLTEMRMLYLQQNKIKKIHPNAFIDLEKLHYMDLSGNQLRLQESFPQTLNLIDLLLDDNGIEEISENTFKNVYNLRLLGLSGNEIIKIHPNGFNYLNNLIELDLSKNKLTTLSPKVFLPITNLEKLDFKDNPLRISTHTFHKLKQLKSLDLEEIEIENINIEMFAHMPHLEFIIFKKYFFCTFTPHVPKCTPKSDGLSTFDNLLGRPILRIILWTVSIITIIGNAYVFWGRSNTRDDNKSLSWIIRNLAVSDFLMGIYLTIIGWKDLEYMGAYHEYSHSWMGSWVCLLAGFLAMLSSEVSIFILVFISIERFLLIAIPFSGHKTISQRAAAQSLIVIWATGIVLAVCPMIMYRNSNSFYGVNGMCFPLHLDDPYFAGWQFSAFIFLLINMVGLLLLAALYSGMFISVWRTQNATCLNRGEFEFAIRFFFIVLTNTACWFPIILLKILAFYRIYIPAAAYAWIAVVVVPVNSAFNPILYTLTTPKYREVIRQAILGRSQTLKHSKPISSADTTLSNTTNSRSRHNTIDQPSSSEDNAQSKHYRLKSVSENACKMTDHSLDFNEAQTSISYDTKTNHYLTESSKEESVDYNDVYM